MTAITGEIDAAARDLDAAGADPRSVALVDFDHTLFGANSTELFLASARPAFMASIILCLVREIMPWYYASPRKWSRVRDFMSVVAIAVLMPWHLLVWRARAKAIFARHAVSPVAEALRAVPADRTVIVSFGYNAIIGPLLRGSAWASCRRLSMPLFPAPRRLFVGKLAAVQAALPGIDLARAVFVTDSESDRDLLNAVGSPHLIAPVGETTVAEQTLYLPLRYTGTAKYNRITIADQIFSSNFWRSSWRRCRPSASPWRTSLVS